jgi:hypothetical protein
MEWSVIWTKNLMTQLVARLFHQELHGNLIPRYLHQGCPTAPLFAYFRNARMRLAGGEEPVELKGRRISID